MEGALPLNIVARQRATTLQLVTGKYDPLLAKRDALHLSNLTHQGEHRVVGVDAYRGGGAS